MTDVRRRTTRGVDPSAAFASLTAVLWNEREAVEHVLFKLVSERLVLAAPAHRWLSRTDDELQRALCDLRGHERERAMAVAELAGTLSLRPECTLDDLIAVAPEPWPTVLSDHRLALRVLVRDIDEAVAETRRLLRASARAVRETLDDLDHLDHLDGPRDGNTTGADPAMTRMLDDFRSVDRALLVTAADLTHRNALQTTAGLVHLGLSDFLA